MVVVVVVVVVFFSYMAVHDDQRSPLGNIQQNWHKKSGSRMFYEGLEIPIIVKLTSLCCDQVQGCGNTGGPH